MHATIRAVLRANFNHPDAQALFGVGEQALNTFDPKLFTGYSVKHNGSASHHDRMRTIRYGHADDQHLIELVDVMRESGLHPRLSVEPRVSSYVHYYAWGAPAADFKVQPIDDEKAFVYVKEYDALFEFERDENVPALDKFIRKWAQKRGPDGETLVRDAWHVPLYSSTVEQVGYRGVKEVRVEGDEHYLVNYALPDNAETIATHLRQLAPEHCSVRVVDVWVNEAFYRFLGGHIV